MRSVLILMCSVLGAVGCASTSADESGSDVSNLDATGLPTATLRDVSIAGTRNACTGAGAYTEVSVPGSKVGATISAALVRSFGELSKFQSCTVAWNVSTSMVATFNRGILSVLETTTESGTQDTVTTITGLNFDLATGNTLQLSDLFTADGLADLKAECSQQVAAGAVDSANREKAAHLCELFIGHDGREWPVMGGGFVIREEGVDLQIHVDPQAGRPGRSGVMVGWGALGAGAAKHPALIALKR